MRREFRGKEKIWVLREAEEWGFYVERPGYDKCLGRRGSWVHLDDEGEEGQWRPLLDGFIVQQWVDATRADVEEDRDQVKAERLAWISAVVDDVLNDTQRHDFLLHYFVGVRPTEIARLRGVHHTCVSTSLERAVKRLRTAAKAATTDGVLRLSIEDQVRAIVKACAAGVEHKHAAWLQGAMTSLLTRTERGAVRLCVGEGYSTPAATVAMGLRARSVVWQACKSGMGKLCTAYLTSQGGSPELTLLDKQAA